MLRDSWATFPQQIVQKINGLLDQALPNPLKTYQIFKMCQAEGLWEKSFSEFKFQLEEFYHIPWQERSKGDFDRFLNRPIDCHHFEGVGLTFRTAEVCHGEIRDIASWAHHMLRLNYQNDSLIASIETLTKTISDVTHPGYGEKDQDIEFDDFCDAWKKAVDHIYGKKYEVEHDIVLSDLRKLDRALKNQVAQLPPRTVLERIYLTQTEIDWVERSREAVMKGLEMPRYPLSKGPTKIQLVDLLKWLTLWEVGKSVKAAAIQAKVERLRDYIHKECEWLLTNCRR